MNSNINIAPVSVKSDIFHTESLVAHATEIRRLGKRLIADVIEIGRHLTEVRAELQETVGHGHFHAWVSREFEWSDRTTLNFMRVYELSLKSETVSDLNLPMRELYLLAAPSTPEEARNEIIDRAAGGEPVSGAEVKEAIARAKREQNGAAPDATESTESAPGAADDPAASAEARKEFYASAANGDFEPRHEESAPGAGDADHDGGGDDVDHHHHDHDGGDDHAEEPKPAPPEPKAELETLAAIWEMSTSEEQQGIRDRVLIDFFAQPSGTQIAALIPALKHADVVRLLCLLLDQLGVDGALQAMSPAFRQALCVKLPGKSKKLKTMQMVETAAASRDFSVQPRGNGSRAH